MQIETLEDLAAQTGKLIYLVEQLVFRDADGTVQPNAQAVMRTVAVTGLHTSDTGRVFMECCDAQSHPRLSFLQVDRFLGDPARIGLSALFTTAEEAEMQEMMIALSGMPAPLPGGPEQIAPMT